MPADSLTLLLLVGAGLVAGTINSIAGGGSLLTIPLLIFIGLPPTVANATNRIGVFIGGIGATASFHRRGLIPHDWIRLAMAPSIVGVVLGTWAAMTVGDVAFERILAGVLVAGAAWTIWQPLTPPPAGEPAAPKPERRWLLRLAFLALGFYGGFIQAGIGFLFLALFATNGLDLVRANAAKIPLVLAYTAVSIPIFASAGLLDWRAGFAMAVGQYVGGVLGVHLQVLKGQAWVRNVMTAAIVAFALKLLLGG